MAERKTRWTDADLKKEGGPATEYGPWGQSDAGKARYDQIVGEPTSIDEILAGAKQVLHKPSFANQIAAGQSAANLRQPEVDARVEANPMPTGRDALRALLMAPGVVPGPVGVGANLASAALSASEGNFGEAGMQAGFAAVPWWMGKAAKAGQAAEQGGARFLKHAWPSGRGASGAAGDVVSSGPKPLPSGGVPRQLPAGQRQLPPGRSSMDAIMQDTPEVPFEVVDDIPVQPVAPVADELNDLMRAGQAPLRRETVRQQAAGGPSNIVRQRGTADIEAEMRAAGASEKDIRQLYHSSQSTSKGVKFGDKLTKEEQRIEQLLQSMGL
jgi:hypothetical protein